MNEQKKDENPGEEEEKEEQSLPPNQKGYDLGLPKGALAGADPALVVAILNV